jgi:hypothetical protein
MTSQEQKPLPLIIQIAIMILGIVSVQGIGFSVYKLCRKKEGEQQPLIVAQVE